MATPGITTKRVGGNTACLEISSGCKIIICDAGTGIRPLGTNLKKRMKGKRVSAHILLSHLHWDHFIGLPFFKLLYDKKNDFVIGGPAEGRSFGVLLKATMRPPYFPISLSDVPARVKLVTYSTAPFEIGDVHVRPMAVNHPDGALGWRFYFPNGKSLVHVTDNEPVTGNRRLKFIEWMNGADVLVHDAQYSREDYKRHRGWGHSPLSYSVELALAAHVKRLFLFHFDPDADDRALLRTLKAARNMAAGCKRRLKIELAREGLSFLL